MLLNLGASYLLHKTIWAKVATGTFKVILGENEKG
jgi:hypothetical protein